MVMYDDDDPIGANTISRPNTSGRNAPPPPVAYAPPPDTMGDAPGRLRDCDRDKGNQKLLQVMEI